MYWSSLQIIRAACFCWLYSFCSIYTFLLIPPQLRVRARVRVKATRAIRVRVRVRARAIRVIRVNPNPNSPNSPNSPNPSPNHNLSWVGINRKVPYIKIQNIHVLSIFRLKENCKITQNA